MREDYQESKRTADVHVLVLTSTFSAFMPCIRRVRSLSCAPSDRRFGMTQLLRT